MMIGRISTLLTTAFISWPVFAEPISFSFLRDGIGYAAVDKPQLLSLLPADNLFITTESGEEFSIEIKRFSRSFHGNLVISGTTFSNDQFVMVVEPDGNLYGSLVEGPDFYRIQSESGVATMDLARPNAVETPYGDDDIPVDAADLQQSDIDSENLSNASRSSSNFANEDTIYPTYIDGIAIIDVLLYYETALRDYEVVLDYVVELANDILSNTATETRLNVVATRPMTVSSATTNRELLDSMQTDESIASDRRFYGADLVHTVRAAEATDEIENCGVANYSVKRGKGQRDDKHTVGVTQWRPRESYDGFCLDESFAHEIGHNLGSAHQRDDYDPSQLPRGAYEYSHAQSVSGVFRTLMGMGSDERKLSFSTPDYSCEGYPCGVAPGSSSSADNTRSVRNTGHLVSSFEGAFKYEAIQEYPAIGFTCNDGSERFEGIVLRNSSRRTINIKSQVFLNGDGSVRNIYDYDDGVVVAEPGQARSRGFCESNSKFPEMGNEIREGYFIYEHPDTGALVEGQHVFFDANYSGDYSTARISTSDGGSVVGHPARTVRNDQSETITFAPASGYTLSGVTGTCSGSISGNTYTIQNAYEGCSVTAQFTPTATSDNVFRVTLEEPVPGNTYTGIRNLRGWAIASSGIDKIEIYIDGIYQFDTPYGGIRTDVGNAFPEVNDSSNSGFSLAYGYTNLSRGTHTITARAVSKDGSVKESSSTFTVTKFHKPFIGPSDTVNLTGSSCQVSGDRMSVIDALIDGRRYDLDLQWRTAAQDFEIIDIE